MIASLRKISWYVTARPSVRAFRLRPLHRAGAGFIASIVGMRRRPRHHPDMGMYWMISDRGWRHLGVVDLICGSPTSGSFASCRPAFEPIKIMPAAKVHRNSASCIPAKDRMIIIRRNRKAVSNEFDNLVSLSSGHMRRAPGITWPASCHVCPGGAGSNLIPAGSMTRETVDTPLAAGLRKSMGRRLTKQPRSF